VAVVKQRLNPDNHEVSTRERRRRKVATHFAASWCFPENMLGKFVFAIRRAKLSSALFVELNIYTIFRETVFVSECYAKFVNESLMLLVCSTKN
jgi:hypothetical protein